MVGLEIANNLGVADGSGIRFVGSGTDIELRDNVIHDMRGDAAVGITVYGTEALAIRNLVIDGNGIFDCEPANSENLVLSGNVDGFVITGNLLRDNNNIGIDLIGGETDIQPDRTLVARNGLVRGNTVIRSNSDYAGGFAAGIYVDGGRDILIENNFVTGSDFGIEVGAENPGQVTEGVVVRNNVLYKNEKAGLLFGGFEASRGRAWGNEFRGNTLYHNNTLGPDGQGRFFAGNGIGKVLVQWSEGNVFENNLVYAGEFNVFFAVGEQDSSVGNRFDYNLYFSDGGVGQGLFSLNAAEYSGFPAWRLATGEDTNSVVGDPLLADPAGGDFHLLAGSPTIDRGNPGFVPNVGKVDLGGEARRVGPAVDVGADEVASASGCVTSATTMCLNRGRFQVELTWRDFNGNVGDGHRVELPVSLDDSGLFWFFSADNWTAVASTGGTGSSPQPRRASVYASRPGPGGGSGAEL